MSAPDLDDLYNATILERARRPRHQHRLEPFDAEVREINPLCGDRVTLRLRCDAAGRIAAIGYEARACAICLAAADILADVAAAFARALRSGEAAAWHGRLAVLRLFAALHDTPSRIGCATLPWEALTHALGQAPMQAREDETDG
jgi:nitrogen fixation NifU-like protein